MSSNRTENESGLIDKPAGWSAEESIGQARRSGGAECNKGDLKFGTRTTHGGLDLLSGARLEDEVHTVARETSANYSSMLVDMRQGGILEVDYMNGYLGQLGKLYKVPTPTIDVLKNMVELKASI